MIVLFRSIRILAAPFACAAAAPQGARADLLDPITNLFSAAAKIQDRDHADHPGRRLYNQGLVFLKRNDFENAAKKFGELEKQYPFSQWARKALLMTTFAQYEKPAYDDAVASATRYVGLYPKSPETPICITSAACLTITRSPM